MTRTGFQVIVRGRFAELDAATRDRLRTEADAHDVFSAHFTAEGSLTYDASLYAFTLRYLIDAEAADDLDEAQLLAEDRAHAALAAAGYPHGELRSSATDLTQVKIRRKSR